MSPGALSTEGLRRASSLYSQRSNQRRALYSQRSNQRKVTPRVCHHKKEEPRGFPLTERGLIKNQNGKGRKVMTRKKVALMCNSKGSFATCSHYRFARCSANQHAPRPCQSFFLPVAPGAVGLVPLAGKGSRHSQILLGMLCSHLAPLPPYLSTSLPFCPGEQSASATADQALPSGVSRRSSGRQVAPDFHEAVVAG